MAARPGIQITQELLMAFADGELAPDETAAVLRHLAEHPEALALMDQEQQLRGAARRLLRGAAPAAPDALRARIIALATGDDAGSAHVVAAAPAPPGAAATEFVETGGGGGAARQVAASGSGRGAIPFARGRTGGWLAAIAASVVIGGIAGRLVFPPATPQTPLATGTGTGTDTAIGTGTDTGTGAIVPATVVSDVTRIHVNCSRLAAALHAAPFPQALGELATRVRADLRTDQPYPDLSRVGYEYVGAGPCGKTLEGTVHLLYRATRPGLNDTLSVFVQAYAGQFQLDAGKAYLLAGASAGAGSAAHPVIAWRSDHVVYFVVADDRKTADAARDAIRPAPI